MKSAIFQVRIQLDEDAEVNPVHLCEEIQAYLNSWHSGNDEYQDANVTGYHVESDPMISFDDTVSVEQCITDGNDYSDCVDHLVQSMETNS